ncbi:hypothetical protein CVT26_011434, partial [Gymnopilus dilepis]
MMAENTLAMDDHPLLLEIQSLRAAVAQFQEEAHASALKLQHHSLASTHAHERAAHLERENDALRAEVAVLRANPYPPSSSSTTHASHHPSPLETHSQVQELTLSLRRLSHKLTLTEDALLSKTTALAAAQAEAARAGRLREAAYELGARVRGREEEALGRAGELELKVRTLEEQLRMSDSVIQEYAALVRRMEGVRSSTSSTFSDAEKEKEKSSHLPLCLHDHKTLLDSLSAQFASESQELQSRLHQKTAELELCRAELDVERKTNERVIAELGREKTELEKLRLEDGTAAKMVARYMQFSQSQSHHHLSSLSTLQRRHSATLASLTTTNSLLTSRIASLQSQNEQLRRALDELGGEYMKEAWGRRREVAVRLRMGGREERVGEGVRRWVRRGEEWVGRVRGLMSSPSSLSSTSSELSSASPSDADPAPAPALALALEALLDLSQHARILLSELDSGILDEQAALSLSSGKARKLVVQMGLDGLLEELRRETGRRVGAERRVAQMTGEAPDKNPHLEASPPSELSPPTATVENGVAHPLLGELDTKIPETPTPDAADVGSSVEDEDSPGAVSEPEARSIVVENTNSDASASSTQEVEQDISSPSPPPLALADSPVHDPPLLQNPTNDAPAEKELSADASPPPAPVDGDQAPSREADKADSPVLLPRILVQEDVADVQTTDSVHEPVGAQADTSAIDSNLQPADTQTPTIVQSDEGQANTVSFLSSTSTPRPSSPS